MCVKIVQRIAHDGNQISATYFKGSVVDLSTNLSRCASSQYMCVIANCRNISTIIVKRH